MRPRARVIGIALDTVGVCITLLALAVSLYALRVPIDPFDEGILLTDAKAMLHGAAPYRDFYSNYPPGIFLLIAGVWRVVGVSVVAERLLGYCIHIALAAFAGRLAGRLAGRRFVWLASGLTLKWLFIYQLSAFAYLAAVAAALCTVELVLRACERPERARRWFAVGVSFGAVSALRHDLAVFFALACLPVMAWLWWRGDFRFADRAVRRALVWGGAGVLIVVVAVWGPTFARAGVRAVVNDLYFDQVRYVLPARVLPFPPLWTLTAHPWLPLRVPAFLATMPAGSVVLALCAPLVGVAAWLWRRRARDANALVAALLAAVGAAILPQVVGRSDVWHVSYAAAPALALLCGLGDRLARARVGGLLATVVVNAWLYQIAIGLLWPPGWPKVPAETAMLGLPQVGLISDADPQTHRAIVDFVHAHTRPGEPIFVGAQRHDNVMSSRVDLYFMANRPGATRYQQFDPNIVTRADVQTEMVAELERKRPQVAVLSPELKWFEPNLSQADGAKVLDEYLASHYAVAKELGGFRLLLRKP